MDLQSERLLLREFVPSDGNVFARYWSDPMVQRFMMEGQRTATEASQYITASIAAADHDPRTFYGLAICLPDSPDPIGSCVLSTNNSQPATMGWDLAPAFWNKGYATEATRRVLQFAFDELDVPAVESVCDLDNAASRRIMEKLDMQCRTNTRMEQMRLSMVYRRPRGVVRYELTREHFEWARLEQTMLSR